MKKIVHIETLLLFSSNRESPNKSKSFLTLSGIESILSQTDFTLFIRSNDGMKNDGSAEGNVKYLRSLNYKNLRDSESFENFVEICAR